MGYLSPQRCVMTAYERLIALAVSLTLALAGGWYIFGRLALDLKGWRRRILQACDNGPCCPDRWRGVRVG